METGLTRECCAGVVATFVVAVVCTSVGCVLLRRVFHEERHDEETDNSLNERREGRDSARPPLYKVSASL